MRDSWLMFGIIALASVGACSDRSTDVEPSGESNGNESAARTHSEARRTVVKVVIPEGTYEFETPDTCVAVANMGIFQFTTRSANVVPGEEFRLAVVQSGSRNLTVDVTAGDSGWTAQQAPDMNTANVSETRFHFEGTARGRRYDSEPANIVVTIDCN